MPFSLKKLLPLLLAIPSTFAVGGGSNTAITTRYWDCCKPSCAWPGKGQTHGLVGTCDIHGKPLTDPNAGSACDKQKPGPAFSCSSQTPWAVSDKLAYGFAAVNGAKPNCCSCYKLKFTTELVGKEMIVQVTNTGDDVGDAQFDLAMPGGGFGAFDACTKQYGATPAIWGDTYGGMHSNMCPKIPAAVQPGCEFRWDWMEGKSNPNVSYEEVACPAELVKKSGCGIAVSTTPSSSTPSNPNSSTPSTVPYPIGNSTVPDSPTGTGTGTGTGTVPSASSSGGVGGVGGAGGAANETADGSYRLSPERSAHRGREHRGGERVPVRRMRAFEH